MTISRRFFLKFAGAASSVAAMAIPVVAAVAADTPAALAPMAAKVAHPWKWWVSFDGGNVYDENFPTKESAERYAANSGGGLIAECQQQDFDLSIDGDTLLERWEGYLKTRSA